MAKEFQLDRETFRRTEKALFSFYEGELRVKNLRDKIERLENQVREIDKNIRNNNVSISPQSKSQTYEERVQTSSDGTSYAEREFIKAIENLEKEKRYKLTIITNLNIELRKIEENQISIQQNLQMLSEDDLKFIELKYKDKLSVEEVSDINCLSRSAGYKKRDKLVYDIANWNEIIN